MSVCALRAYCVFGFRPLFSWKIPNYLQKWDLWYFTGQGLGCFNNAHRHSLIAWSLSRCGLEWSWSGVSHYGDEQWINSLFALLPVELTCSDWLNDLYYLISFTRFLSQLINVYFSLCSLSSPKPSALTLLHLCFPLYPFLNTIHPFYLPSCRLPFPIPPPQGGPVIPGLPEVQVGGRLSPLLPGIHGPQPGCSRSSLHLLWWGWPGEPRRRRGAGQQRWSFWRHRRLPASGLLRY